MTLVLFLWFAPPDLTEPPHVDGVLFELNEDPDPLEALV